MEQNIEIASIIDFIGEARSNLINAERNISTSLFTNNMDSGEPTTAYRNIPMSFLIDYRTVQYRFIDPSLKAIVGYSLDYFRQGGLEFTVDIYHPKDFSIYSNNIFTQNVRFLKSIPFNEHPDYVFTHNYRLKNKEGKYTQLLQQYSIIHSAPDGTPLVFLFHVVEISHWKDNPVIVHRIEKNITVDGLFIKRIPVWERCYKDRSILDMLTNREIEIVKMIHDGCTSSQISRLLNISLNTVHNHRKNILVKSGCGTSAALIRMALEDELIN